MADVASFWPCITPPQALSRSHTHTWISPRAYDKIQAHGCYAFAPFESKALLVDYPSSPRLIEWEVDLEGIPRHMDGMDRNGLTFDDVDALVVIFSDATFDLTFTPHDESAVAAAVAECRPGLSQRPADPLWDFS